MPLRIRRHHVQLAGRRLLLPAAMAVGVLLVAPVGSAMAAKWEGRTSQEAPRPNDGLKHFKYYEFSFSAGATPTKVSNIRFKWKATCDNGVTREFGAKLPGPYEVSDNQFEAKKSKKAKGRPLLALKVTGNFGTGGGKGKSGGRFSAYRRERLPSGELNRCRTKEKWRASYTVKRRTEKRRRKSPPRKRQSPRSAVW